MGARGRTTADGSVVLNLHRGAGAYARAHGRAADPSGGATFRGICAGFCMICMAARCAWIDEGEGAGGLLVMLGVLAMLPQLRGVETEVRFHAPEAFRVSSKAASLAPTTPSILQLIHVQSTLCASHGNPACQPVTPSRFWHDMFFLHAFCVGFCTDVTLIFLHDFAC